MPSAGLRGRSHFMRHASCAPEARHRFRGPSVRLAVFTNEFPGRPVTFFSRDMRALVDEGCEVDIFPFYPLDAALWGDVGETLDDRVLPRERIHHISLTDVVQSLRFSGLRRLPSFLADLARI